MSGGAGSYNPTTVEFQNVDGPQEIMDMSIADLRLFRCAGCYNETKIVGALKCEDSDASTEDSEQEDSDSDDEKDGSGQDIAEIQKFPEADERTSETTPETLR